MLCHSIKRESHVCLEKRAIRKGRNMHRIRVARGSTNPPACTAARLWISEQPHDTAHTGNPTHISFYLYFPTTSSRNLSPKDTLQPRRHTGDHQGMGVHSFFFVMSFFFSRSLRVCVFLSFLVSFFLLSCNNNKSGRAGIIRANSAFFSCFSLSVVPSGPRAYLVMKWERRQAKRTEMRTDEKDLL